MGHINLPPMSTQYLRPYIDITSHASDEVFTFLLRNFGTLFLDIKNQRQSEEHLSLEMDKSITELTNIEIF